MLHVLPGFLAHQFPLHLGALFSVSLLHFDLLQILLHALTPHTLVVTHACGHLVEARVAHRCLRCTPVLVFSVLLGSHLSLLEILAPLSLDLLLLALLVCEELVVDLLHPILALASLLNLEIQ